MGNPGLEGGVKMKSLLCALILVCTASVSIGADAWTSIQLHKENIYSVQDCEYLKKILPQYSERLDKLIIATKQGKTFQYAVEIKVEPIDEKATSVTLYKPNGTSIPIQWNAEDQEFSFSSWNNPCFSLEEFAADFPAGEYRIDVTFVSSSIKSWYTTIPDHNTMPFTDIPDAALSQDLAGQLILNWSAVEGTDEYDIGASFLDGRELYHEDFVFSYPHDESSLLGIYKSKGNYEIELTACVWDGDIEFHTHALLFSFKNPPAAIQNKIDKCTVKAGTKKNSDSLSFAGLLDAIEADLIIEDGNDIIVTIEADNMTSPLEFRFPINAVAFKKGLYNYARTENASTRSFKFDTKNGKMTFNAKGIDLTGLACPITLTITIGDYEAEFELDESIVNGSKALSPVFLMGVANSITVSKSKAKHATSPDADSLTVTGTFTIAGSYDKKNDFAVTVGAKTFTILGSQMITKGQTESCSKVSCNEGGLLSAKLDFAKCTFTITLTGVNLDPGTQIFGVSVFGNYLEAETKISDHVFDIAITYSWDYDSPDDSLDNEYVLYVESHTDSTIDHIEFATPAGNTFEIPNTPLTEYPITGGTLEIGTEFDDETGQYYWFYSPRFSNSSSLSAYGDGLYTFTIYYTNSRSQQTTAWFGIPGTLNPIPQPTQIPVFTSFDNGDTVTSPVTFTWQACTDPAASSIEFDLSHESGEEEGFKLPVSATAIKPLKMITGVWEDVELSFERNYQSQNSDGITIFTSKYSESDYYLTVEQ
jgi:hypothetical protein